MNQWTITGIDRETGKELMFCVEAQTHDEAVRQGGKRAVVRKVRKVEVEPVASYYQPKEWSAPTLVPIRLEEDADGVPFYRDIDDGCETLATLANVLWGVAILSWVGAALNLIVFIEKGEIFAAIVGACSLAFHGLIWFVAAFLIKKTGSLARAIRDMARNSFSFNLKSPRTPSDSRPISPLSPPA